MTCQLPKLNVVGSNPIARFLTPVDMTCQRVSILRTFKAFGPTPNPAASAGTFPLQVRPSSNGIQLCYDN